MKNSLLIAKNKKLFDKLNIDINKKDYTVYCDPKFDINYKTINNLAV